jgi:hypothetical protein
MQYNSSMVPTNAVGCHEATGGNSKGRTGYQQPEQQPTKQKLAPLRPPAPYKCYKNWCYCHTHWGNVDDSHTSATCAKPSLMHNPHSTSANTMGGSTAGMHKTILPSASGRAPMVARAPMQCPPIQTAWQQPMPPPQLCCHDGTHRHASTNAGISATEADALHGAASCTSPCACHNSPTSRWYGTILQPLPSTSPFLMIWGAGWL